MLSVGHVQLRLSGLHGLELVEDASGGGRLTYKLRGSAIGVCFPVVIGLEDVFVVHEGVLLPPSALFLVFLSHRNCSTWILL